MRHYTISEVEGIRLLARCDRLRIIDLLPNNRTRVARNFAWIADGPIQQYFRGELQTDFFASRFDGKSESLAFVSGMLSRTSNAAFSTICDGSVPNLRSPTIRIATCRCPSALVPAC